MHGDWISCGVMRVYGIIPPSRLCLYRLGISVSLCKMQQDRIGSGHEEGLAFGLVGGG